MCLMVRHEPGVLKRRRRCPKNKSHGETQIYERMVPCENETAM